MHRQLFAYMQIQIVILHPQRIDFLFDLHHVWIPEEIVIIVTQTESNFDNQLFAGCSLLIVVLMIWKVESFVILSKTTTQSVQIWKETKIQIVYFLEVVAWNNWYGTPNNKIPLKLWYLNWIGTMWRGKAVLQTIK